MKRSNDVRTLARLKTVNGRRQEEISRLLTWCDAAHSASRDTHVSGIFHGLWLAIEGLYFERVSASTLRKLAARVHQKTQDWFGGAS